MVDASWFDDLPDDFEESVRIDRDERDHRRRAIRSYHLTADSRRFLREFVDRMLGESDDMRTGSNYWLYGYYGSGKSHLLTVLDGLLDSDWLDGRRDVVWRDLVHPSKGDGLPRLHDHWETVHDECYVIPISVNLLRYQGQKQRSFSEIVLSHAHRNPKLTGIDDGISEGLSSQLDVAYFEKWLRTTDAWPERQARAGAVLERVTTASAEYDWRTDGLWEDVQRYGAVADIVLPRLFEEVNGIPDGFRDLVPSDIDSAEAVSRLEELRAEREADVGRPVKLVLLLDEVSLFIGTDFERLTELQTLAEHVDDVEDDDIQLVVTAQANIEDVQPRFAAHGADFTILKDRFPHRYQLPSKHVGDIARRRLLEKTETGSGAVREVLDAASVKPTESLVYNEIEQNTKPPLDGIDDEELVEFYPFLPYHAPLFLEILFNLRQEAADPAKSIFSGTARAILALMHTLLQTWIGEGESDQLVTLVDFYELVEPELREILEQDVRVIEGSTASRGIADEVEDGTLEAFDLEVAKAVLLLQHVHDIVPLSEGNIAVSVMSDLNGRSWIGTQNRVEESLGRLQKFIRPTEDETGPRFRFATQEERLIYEGAEANEREPDWDAVLQALDDHLWGRIARELSLPESVPYGDAGDEYDVGYSFGVDGVEFGTTVDADGGLDVSIGVHGVRPEYTPEKRDEETLYWSIDAAGLDDLRSHLVSWWALRDAISTRTPPAAVARDLDRRARAVRRKLVGAMQGGSYAVKDRTDLRSISDAVRTTVDVAYPDDFHPMLLQVTDDRLRELAESSPGDPLPAWAHAIQVPSSEPDAGRGRRTIQRNVLALTGRQLRGREDGLAMNTVLDGIVSEKPFYAGARPALRAIIWGFCRAERFVPVDEDGNPRENAAVLDRDRLSTTRLKLLPRESPGKCLEEGGYKQTTETVADGLIALREANERLRSSLTGLREDVQLVSETDVHSDAVSGLLGSFIDELVGRADETAERLTAIRSQDGICNVVEETNGELAWFEDVADVWNRRRAALYRFDAQLAAGDGRFDWVDDDARAAVAAQRDALVSFEGCWWATDGWKALASETTTGLGRELQRSWDDHVDERGLSTFVDRIADHPWIVSPMELPPGVQIAMEREYVTPLRELWQWFESVDATVSSLSSDDEDALASAAEGFAGMEPLAGATSYDVGELESRFERLAATVGDRAPHEVDLVGVLPDDRQPIERRLERLAEDHDLHVEPTDSGVVVR